MKFTCFMFDSNITPSLLPYTNTSIVHNNEAIVLCWQFNRIPPFCMLKRKPQAQEPVTCAGPGHQTRIYCLN